MKEVITIVYIFVHDVDDDGTVYDSVLMILSFL